MFIHETGCVRFAWNQVNFGHVHFFLSTVGFNPTKKEKRKKPYCNQRILLIKWITLYSLRICWNAWLWYFDDIMTARDDQFYRVIGEHVVCGSLKICNKTNTHPALQTITNDPSQKLKLANVWWRASSTALNQPTQTWIKF